MVEDDLMKVKVCFIGDAGVGKTSLIKRFVLDVFDDRYIATIGTKVTKKIVDVEGDQTKVMMLVWDIMGQKGFRELLREAYFFGAHGAIAVCDLTNKETLEELRYWIKALTDVAGDVPIVFAGNKVSVKRDPGRSLSMAEVGLGVLNGARFIIGTGAWYPAPYTDHDPVTGEMPSVGAISFGTCYVEIEVDGAILRMDVPEGNPVVPLGDNVRPDRSRGNGG